MRLPESVLSTRYSRLPLPAAWVFLLIAAGAADPALGQSWQTHLYGNDLRGVAAGPGGIYGASSGGALLYRPSEETFRQWNREANGLLSDTLTCVAVDPQGRVWFGTAGRGISLFDPQSQVFTPFTSLLEPIPSDDIVNIVMQEEWTLVFAVGGFSVFRDGQLQWVCMEGLDLCGVPNWDLRTGAVYDGDVWVGAASGDVPGGVASLDLSSGVWTDATGGLEDPDLRDMTVHGTALWCATARGVAVRAGGEWEESVAGLPANGGWRDLVSAADTLWVAGTEGLYFLAPGGMAWSQAPGAPRKITGIARDGEGRLWAGTGGAAPGTAALSPSEDGLWQRSGGDWIQRRHAGPPSRNHYRDLVFDRRGRLWGSQARSGTQPIISVRDGGAWSFVDKASDPVLLTGWSLSLLADGDNLWLGNCCCSQDALELCYTEVLTPGGPLRFSEAVNTRDMVRDAQGRIWFASFSENSAFAFGLARLDPSDSTWVVVNTATPGAELRNNSLRALGLDGNVLWVGYAENGVSRWDFGSDGEALTGDDSWTHCSRSEPGCTIVGDLTTVIAVGPEGVWIGSDSGVSLVRDDGTIRFLRSGLNRLPSSEIKDIVPAGDGGAWIATRGAGVTRVRPDGSGGFVYETFGPPGLVHPDVEALALDPDGDSVWLGTVYGLSRLTPAAGAGQGAERPGVYPNPYRPSCGGTLRILGVAGRVDGVVVDAGGRVVARFEGAAAGDVVWDGRRDGAVAASGLYMIRVRSSRGKQSIPLAVLDGNCGS